MSEQPIFAPALDLWTRLFHIARRILQVGAVLGAVAYLFLGRKFRNEELGILVWPLTALYLLSFFYILTFLVFTSVKSRLRYLVISLWLLMVLLMTGALASLAFNNRGKIEPDRAANEGQPIRSETNRASSAAGSHR
jgi:hypothetical protein